MTVSAVYCGVAQKPTCAADAALPFSSCPSSPSLRSSAHAGARADQRLVDGDAQAQAGHDWRDGREPRPLRRLPMAGVAIPRDLFADILRMITATAVLCVHGAERSRGMSSSQTTAKVRPDDRQIGNFPCQNLGFGRSSGVPRSGGALQDGTVLSKAANPSIFASQPGCPSDEYRVIPT